MRSQPWLAVVTCIGIALAAGCGPHDSETAKPANTQAESQAARTTTPLEFADARAEVEWASGLLLSWRNFEAARRQVRRWKRLEEWLERTSALNGEIKWRFERHNGLGRAWHPWADPKFPRQPNYDRRR